MSGRPGTTEGTPITTSSPSNSNGVASNPPIGGAHLNPPKADMAPQPQHLPTTTNPHPSTPSAMDTQADNNDTSTIPPLMGIRPTVSSFPPPPPAQLPPPPLLPPPLPSAQFLPPPAVLKAPQPTQHTVSPVGNTIPGVSGSAPSAIPLAPGSSSNPTPKSNTQASQSKANAVPNRLKQGYTASPGKQMKGVEDKEEDAKGYVDFDFCCLIFVVGFCWVLLC